MNSNTIQALKYNNNKTLVRSDNGHSLAIG